jgi:hypothetical protein
LVVEAVLTALYALGPLPTHPLTGIQM